MAAFLLGGPLAVSYWLVDPRIPETAVEARHVVVIAIFGVPYRSLISLISPIRVRVSGFRTRCDDNCATALVYRLTHCDDAYVSLVSSQTSGTESSRTQCPAKANPK